MFLGTFLVSVTSGKRTSVPSIFRQELGAKLIIAKWYENCLVLVGFDGFSDLLKRITGGQKMIITPIRDTEHFIHASAYQVEADDQGRIVLPDRLVEYANLGDQVYFLGIGDRIEIWNKESWEIKERTVSLEAAKYIEQLANDSLKHRSDEEKT